MNHVLFRKSSRNLLSRIRTQDIGLDRLGLFLQEACWSLTPEYIKWIKEPHEVDDMTGLNNYGITWEKDNQVAIVIDSFDDDGEYSQELTESRKFIMDKKQIIEILEHWNKIINMKPLPNEVHLVQDEDKIWLEIKS